MIGQDPKQKAESIFKTQSGITAYKKILHAIDQLIRPTPLDPKRPIIVIRQSVAFKITAVK